jgi:hypothetical protein
MSYIDIGLMFMCYTVALLIVLFVPDTVRCPKCGVCMEPYDDKRDVCVNPNCPIKP